MEKVIYIIEEEHSSGVDCCTHGSWEEEEKALNEFKKLVEKDKDFGENSSVNYEEGIAESDPEYTEDDYTIYKVWKLPLK